MNFFCKRNVTDTLNTHEIYSKQKKVFCFSVLRETISQLQMGAVTSRPQCLAASLVTKMSVALYLFSSRDLVFNGRKKANKEPYDREVFKE